jgi:hypothetical protein
VTTPEVVEPKKTVAYADLIRFAFDTKIQGLMSEKLKDTWNKFLDKIESLEITEYLSFQLLARLRCH